MLTTFDSDVALKANNSREIAAHVLAKSLIAVKGSHWGSHSMSYSSPMSACSVAAAAAALRRAKHVGTVSGGGKEGEALRGAPQQVATILAMRAATSAAVTSVDGILGFDVRIVESICSKLASIFQSQGAVQLQSPLLRPRDSTDFTQSLNGPAEVLNGRGSVLLLQEDLTVTFARAISRGGVSTNNIKRFDIGKVYHESDAGGVSFPLCSDYLCFECFHRGLCCLGFFCIDVWAIGVS